mgnify:FL=1
MASCHKKGVKRNDWWDHRALDQGRWDWHCCLCNVCRSQACTVMNGHTLEDLFLQWNVEAFNVMLWMNVLTQNYICMCINLYAQVRMQKFVCVCKSLSIWSGRSSVNHSLNIKLRVGVTCRFNVKKAHDRQVGRQWASSSIQLRPRATTWHIHCLHGVETMRSRTPWVLL